MSNTLGIKACVIGWPIAHSRSPIVHGAWLKQYGIAGTYDKVAVAPEQLARFAETMADRGYAGCNVTIPHKEAMYKLADERAASAVAIGAANTVWLDHGWICVANTDAYGFMTHLTRSAPGWLHRQGPVCVLGAGGSARSVVYGFLEAGVTDVRIFNRTIDRATMLARALDAGGERVHALPWERLAEGTRGAVAIVNTTSLGMNGKGCPPIDFNDRDRETVVADIVYVPLETEFLACARRAGLVTVDGLGMLLHQAVPGFELWFGVRPEVTPELRALVVADIEGR
jgi:shikimate dehydrogenase